MCMAKIINYENLFDIMFFVFFSTIFIEGAVLKITNSQHFISSVFIVAQCSM